MKTNVAAIDRLMRFGFGLVLVGLAYTDTVGPWGYVGLVGVVTSVLGWCPLYALLGMNTARAKDSA